MCHLPGSSHQATHPLAFPGPTRYDGGFLHAGASPCDGLHPFCSCSAVRSRTAARHKTSSLTGKSAHLLDRIFQRRLHCCTRRRQRPGQTLGSRNAKEVLAYSAHDHEAPDGVPVVRGLAFSPDGKLLLSSVGDGIVRSTDTATREQSKRSWIPMRDCTPNCDSHPTAESCWSAVCSWTRANCSSTSRTREAARNWFTSGRGLPF